jgi:hypothetical protein
MTTIHDATDQAPRYASPVDYEAYGQYGPGRGFEGGQGFHRPRYRFQGRITADGSYQAERGRYHLYIAWGCPWAQRTANLGGYARDLYQRPAFRDTTDFAAFGMFAAGPRPSFFNDASWRIRVEPVHADWTARTAVRP